MSFATIFFWLELIQSVLDKGHQSGEQRNLSSKVDGDKYGGMEANYLTSRGLDIFHIKLLGGLNEIMCVKYLTQSLAHTSKIF